MSLTSLNSRRILCTLLCALTVLLSVPGLIQAQMFSVDNTEAYSTVPDVGIYAGIEAVDFEYQGSEMPGTASGIYAFNGTVARFMLEGRGLTFYLGTGGDFTGLEDVSYFDGGVKAGYDLSLYRSRTVNVQLPVQLHSTFTRVSNDEVLAPSAPEFQQGTFELGGGVDFNARPAPQFRVGLNLVPSYGFAFSTRERDAGGSILGLEGEARVYFDRLFERAGLSLGYNYNFREYDIEGEILDYKAAGHRFLIGITF